jgi:hypothetical protein
MTGSSLTYLIQSLPWAVAGFLAGCLSTLQIRPTPDALAPPENTMATAPQKKPRRFTLVHIIGLVVLVLTIFSAIQTQVQSDANDRLTRCLVTYANATADAIDARSKAATEAQKATIAMWRTVFEQPQTDAGRAEARRVFAEYLQKQEASIQTQQTNPYPAAPRDVCPADAR